MKKKKTCIWIYCPKAGTQNSMVQSGTVPDFTDNLTDFWFSS